MWGTRALPGRAAEAAAWYRALLGGVGATTEIVIRGRVTTVISPDWERLLDPLAERTVMVVGRVGSGKSTLARWLAAALAARHGGAVALLDSDMGQASIGVPTCLGLALGPRWSEPAAMWFIGDTSPVGNLIPAVVGAAKLAAHARHLGARTLVVTPPASPTARSRACSSTTRPSRLAPTT